MTENPEKQLSERVRELVAELTPDEQRLMMGVIKAERDKLHMKNPRNINEDLWKLLMAAIQ